MKKIFSIIISITFILNIFSMNVFAVSENTEIATIGSDGQITDEGGRTPDSGLNISKIALTKVIDPTSKENFFDISLEVETTRKVIDAGDVAVVVAMDISNSMTDTSNNEQKIKYAKDAAKQFIDEFSVADSLGVNRKLGFVVFNSNACVPSGLSLQISNTSNAEAMKTAVDNIRLPVSGESEFAYRFTNIEAGLQLAANQLENIGATHKYIILITDGLPTTYIKSDQDRTNVTRLEGWDVYGTYNKNSGQTTIGADGSFYDYVTSPGKIVACNGTSYSDTAAIKAETVATAAKSDINIFSVGIALESQQIQSFIDTKAYIVESRTANRTQFAIADTSDGFVNWLTNEISGGPALNEGDVKYLSGDTGAELKAAYNELLNKIIEINEEEIEDSWIVYDPMGEQVDFVNFYTLAGSATPDSMISDDKSENYVVWDEETQSFKWDLKKSPCEEIIEEDTITFRYTLKYKVRLKNETGDFMVDVDYATNGDAQLIYRPVDNGVLQDEVTFSFPVPAVEGYTGSFHFKKVDERGNPLVDAEFTLEHSNSCSSCENSVAVQSIVITSDENGMVEYGNIPSSHDYVLKETKPPEGYKKIEDHYLKVAQGKVYLDNNEVLSDVVFSDEKIEPVSYSIVAHKTVNGNNIEETDNHNFLFELYDENNNLLQTKPNTGSQVVFDAYEYSTKGQYTYYIKEVIQNHDTLYYDHEVYKVILNVAPDNPQDPVQYAVTPEYIKSDNSSSDEIIFNNIDRLPAKVPIKAYKKLINTDGNVEEIEEGRFTFVLSGEDGTYIQAENKADNTVDFGELVFNSKGTYRYTISELKQGANNTVVFDDTIYGIVIDISCTADSPEYLAEISYTKNGEPYTVDDNSNSLIFTNYTAQLKATVPMYVCMYGYSGTGNVVTPTNYGITNYSSLDIVISNINVTTQDWILNPDYKNLNAGEIYMKMHDTILGAGDNIPADSHNWIIAKGNDEDNIGTYMNIPLSCYIAGGGVNKAGCHSTMKVSFTVATVNEIFYK